MSITPTLESALADLPAKPRVHELSKRIGISNKELLTALAERGLTIKSASSSVPADVARQVIEAFLAPADAPDGQAAGTADESAAAPDGNDADKGQHPDLPTGTRPLFLPPEVVRAETDGQGGDGPGPDDAEGAQDRPAGSGRRRRGRSGRRGGGGHPVESEPTLTDREPESATDGAATGGPDAETSADGRTDHTADTAQATDESDDSDDQASDDQASDDQVGDASGRGRRRRRGRRGRGRVSDDAAGDDAAGDEAAGSDGEGADAQRTDEGAGDDSAAPGSSHAGATDEESAESGESAETDESDDRGAGSAGSRRRRRRRRRVTGEDGPREGDPDNTVVHVREPRLSGAAGSGASSGSSEVQGVRGSTRLEAKRQRRRDSRDSRRRPQILTEAEFLARRESVERVMAVRQRGDLAQVALLEDGILVEHFVSRAGSDSMIGSVFLGKVQNVLPSMEAAFVDIGRGRNAVLYAGEVNWDAAGLNGKARRIETALSSGDTILAQVSKDPIGHKGARLTTQISLPGRFLVYVPNGGATGISRKLPDTERKRLKSILDRIVPEDAGVIIRTAAEGIAEDELARDVERLKAQWEDISRRAAAKTSAPTQLYAEPGTLLKVVRDLFNSDISRLVVDGDEAFEPVSEYITAVAPELADRLSKYEAPAGGGDVFATYRVDEQIGKALERKVHLPSGGSLVIDRTEAMTVVDVNTGKYTGSGGNLEETVTKNNLEAAEEIVRQLRLRDIGGIIVIDFIDMVLESNRELVLRRLTECLGRDRTRHQVAEVTSLGLVQMTRKRMGTGLLEAFSEPCPHCGGRGIILHDAPIDLTPGEDAPAERRAGKNRRNRGRDTEPTEDVVTRVQHALGRKPDPRGPKPPPALVGDDDELEVVPRGRRDSDRTDGSPGDDAGPDTVGGVSVDVLGGAVDGDVLDAGVVTVENADNTENDDNTENAQRVAAAEEGAGGSAPVEAAAPEQPRQPRRSRRSAGRPAGAPTGATQAVDIIVRPVTAESGAESSDTDRDTGADSVNDAANDAVNGGANPNGNGETGSEPAAPAAPVRRRAARRPAGPAAAPIPVDRVDEGGQTDQQAEHQDQPHDAEEGGQTDQQAEHQDQPHDADESVPAV
jgi:ribonuclease E